MKRLSLFFALLMLSVTTILSQKIITGKVLDETGEALIGANVQAKGTTFGTVTDVEGSYTLTVPTETKFITFTFLGYATTDVPIGSTNVVSTILRSSADILTEVVVTGTGSATSKAKIGISVESIKGDRLSQVAIAGIDQALVGKIPGAQISSVSGNPGDQVNIVLRGINTVQAGTRPMILLDGIEIPFSNLNTLDLTQVERVEVVQGAASASLYGAQGANGVIQIFTKKGTKGTLNINVSTSYANNIYINSGNFGKASLHPYLTDGSGNIVSALASGGFKAGQAITIDPLTGIVPGSGSLAYRYGTNVPGVGSSAPGATENYTRYGILDPRNIADQPYKGSLQYYDHFAQVFQSAPSSNVSLNINGGGDKVDYSFTLANNRNNSALLKDNGYLDRTNLVANIGIELFKNFTLRSITNLVYIDNTMHPNIGAGGGTFYGQGNLNAYVGGVYGFLNTSPFFDLTAKNSDGDYTSYNRASFASVNAFNPFYRLEYTNSDDKRIDIIQNLSANYKVNRFVTLDGRFGLSHRNENAYWTFYNQSLNANTIDQGSWASWYNGSDETGEVDNFQYENTKINFFGSATVKLDFANDLKLGIPLQSTTIGGYDYRNNKYREYDTWGQSLPLNPPINLLSTKQQYAILDYVEPFVTYGFVLDQKFDYSNLFGVGGGFRTDYSSAFGAGSKPFTFPHGNAYLNINSFEFWNGLSKSIPIFRFRAAYGQAGIQPGAFDRYPVITQQPTGNELAYTNQVTSRNPDLDVEVSTEKEIGTDIGVKLFGGNWLKDMNINLTYWERKTDNAIFNQNVPPSTGATKLITNAIGLASNGIQLGIKFTVLTSKNFNWDIITNFGHQSTTITKVNGGDIPLTSFAGSTSLVLTPGAKVGQIFGYKALTSISQARADGSPFIAEAQKANYEIVEGRVVNKATNAIFFSDEASSFGDPNPKLISSIISNMSYKDVISFGFQFDAVTGTHLYNQTNEWMYRDGISSDFAKPVTINGKTAAYSSYYASAYYALGTTSKGVGNNVTKDFFYEDASFVRLRNVTLGFDFSRLVSARWLKKCQLVLSGRNLLTFTNYSGMDPEISSGASNSAFDRGIDHSTIPNLKSYQATLNFSF
ncbi:MAG: SusC/RagA family TonB-linked outer membrane protein [Saprospiraceae bacterium]